ncbi:hypothetical protein KDAU_72920 [Dictyobacter aurantiacus]|uniref:Uncharacterized protein n=1 Tax=Dictyobacter aurantiacus TaxID=1936993 RepID=A0A401ZSX1_9CHLR|nr:hypothetical protein KDAU_72920 [Dictyobacter aurantiacus]
MPYQENKYELSTGQVLVILQLKVISLCHKGVELILYRDDNDVILIQE